MYIQRRDNSFSIIYIHMFGPPYPRRILTEIMCQTDQIYTLKSFQLYIVRLGVEIRSAAKTWNISTGNPIHPKKSDPLHFMNENTQNQFYKMECNKSKILSSRLRVLLLFTNPEPEIPFHIKQAKYI